MFKAPRSLGLFEKRRRNWIMAAERARWSLSGVKVITPEQMELLRWRAENARLRIECEILENRRRVTGRSQYPRSR